LSGYDQTLLDFARDLASESANGYPNGPLFWNEIASAFVGALLVRHTSNFDGRVRGALGKDVFQRLRDYIMAHLDEPIEVAALAGIAGRSEFHFTRVFTRSVGMTPHRYVVHQRLQRAVELLGDRRFSLAEIAASTGFARPEPLVALGSAGSRRFSHAAHRMSAWKTAGISRPAVPFSLNNWPTFATFRPGEAGL
jgi:AraC family transcriptional regulator